MSYYQFLFSCCCGRLDKDHQPEATRVIPGSDVTWNVTRHTLEQPTNAYGELEFTGAGQTSRAKVSIAPEQCTNLALHLQDVNLLVFFRRNAILVVRAIITRVYI